jgi:predicted acylesterase/phospholipase RssA
MYNNYYDTLVLSGGSVRTISTLGAIQYCYDNNLIQGVKTYIGTSAGGMIAYLLAIGYTPTEIMVYICTHNLFKDYHFDIVSMMSGGGAVNFTLFQEILEQMTIEKIGRLVTLKDIKDLFNKNLILTTYNFSKKELQYLSAETTPDMPCLVAIRMTSSLPLVFSAYKYMNEYYIDGGLCDNFPITYKLDDDNIKSRRLGININMDIEKDDGGNPNNIGLLEYIYKLLTIPMHQNLVNKLDTVKHMDIIKITVDANIFNFGMDTKEKMELYSLGYKQAEYFFEPKDK